METIDSAGRDVLNPRASAICQRPLRGADRRGPAFSAGGNVKQMRDEVGKFAGGPAKYAENYRHGIQRIPRALSGARRASIAAVNGPRSEPAAISPAVRYPYRSRNSAPVRGEDFVKGRHHSRRGGAWLLPRAIGLSRAAEMAFTGDSDRGRHALSPRAWCPASWRPTRSCCAEAKALAAPIASNPPTCCVGPSG